MREIIYFFILITAFSCSSSVLYSELNHDDGVSFYNEKKFSGLAIEKDKSDNIRVEKLYNEGINLSTNLFDSKGNIESEWIYGNSNIFVTRFFWSRLSKLILLVCLIVLFNNELTFDSK